ncbi:MAG: thiamine phosphate synthase, partial [Endomicrobiaceae bacterium]|nr:thiamine phosphate synthase [Endomicrobiaceae bacterium]
EFACQGGADMIQFRDKTLTDKELFKISLDLKEICKKYHVCFTLNNRVDIAYAVEAHGVHVGQSDLPVEKVKQILGPSRIIGLSASSYMQAIDCVKQKADYVGFGAIYPTGTKPESKATGLEVLALVKNRVDLPIIAIGGINERNVEEVILAGADGVAVVQAVCGAQDIKKSAENIKNLILQAEQKKEKIKDVLNGKC